MVSTLRMPHRHQVSRVSEWHCWGKGDAVGILGLLVGDLLEPAVSFLRSPL